MAFSIIKGKNEMICITSEPIDFCRILENVTDRSSGGIALFLGTVRDHDESKVVLRMYYEIYKEMAEKNLARIEYEVKTKWKINKFVAIHRTGELRVGDVSVAVAASAEHRNQAFEACRYGIDQIKTKVPIWKKEIYNNSSCWVDGNLLNKK
jgi:molybdopterin synthase catalytic subunit